MSLVLNMVGGGSGGSGPSASDAILTVTVPTGSAVTATKGGTTITPTMWVQAADNTLDCALFVIGPSMFDTQNAWTVTATRSVDTASGTVTIDSNEQYDMNLSYRVPSAYQEVEYLASSGTQYIITEIAPKNITRVDCDFWATTIETYCYVWGSWDGSRQNTFGKTLSAANTINCYFNGLGVTSSVNIQTNKKYKTVANCDSKVLTVDGQGHQMTGTLNKTGSLSLWLFTRNNNNSPQDSTANLIGRIYYVAFYNDNTLVDELIPCYRKSDSVAGMWGQVTEIFYTNRGTGMFTVGPDV